MASMKRSVHVVGVGMIPFTKPGASEPYTVMGQRAAQLALDDARARGWKVRPLCSYADAYIRRHPEYNDLLA